MQHEVTSDIIHVFLNRPFRVSELRKRQSRSQNRICGGSQLCVVVFLSLGLLAGVQFSQHVKQPPRVRWYLFL